MSFLQGSSNTTINGGNFVAVSNTGGALIAQKDLVPVLLSHSATAGILDAAERFDAPKCDEGTRVSMLQGMKHFVQQPDGGPSIYWLHGPAGVGKSALAQSLALSLQDDGDHAASFFFSRTAQGRSDGNQLFATLACQLALNIPELQRILTKVVKRNPLIFNATNSTKMQCLIVEPLNQLQKSFRWNPQFLARRLAKRKLHPRLILVDGLDECGDQRVQQDLLLCIGNAVSKLSLPFRFIITSRPESHILATFELDPIFQGPRGVKLTTKNLGDDEDADGQITTFLLKEFAEIRRTHPVRDFLPAQWPLPGQIGQLVAKSSKGFIYPATVIRYIKMPNNRPDKCLERILGLSEIPAQDKPYEPLDALYRYIFESIPDANKEAVRSIFHFLVISSPLEIHTDPEHLDSYLKFESGHVQHVLRDLLCLVSFSQKEPIKILHASLPDFLLNPARSGPLSIDLGDAHATIVASFHGTFLSGYRLQQSKHFGAFLDHLMQANMTSGLFDVLSKFDLRAEYVTFGRRLDDLPRHQEELFSAITSVIAYLTVLVYKDLPTPYIVSHIDALMDYCIQRYPLASAFRAIVNDIGRDFIPNVCYPVLDEQLIFEEIFRLNLSRVELSNDITTLQLLLLSGIFSSPGQSMLDATEISKVEYRHRKGGSSPTHTQIAQTLLPFLMPDFANRSAPYETEFLRPIALRITLFCLQRATHSAQLVAQFEQLRAAYHHAVEFYSERPIGPMIASDFRQLAPAILDLLDTFHRSANANAQQLTTLRGQYQQLLTRIQHIHPSVENAV